ncbi:helix-turn-helix protein [Scopulibacillus darangshiensis]|uniref:Helix-turn-helix protein n=1 Tax=Scopulibacillus darangshiensis TaxID=442528 RepID=A0A4R2P246_9BACL|nr:helix-turn-helix transcriptional regulator [Scopulibacillus darangshiensis]TCP28789.1 helix-turn-helix protein [Scopulibacillus darangshiensis]
MVHYTAYNDLKTLIKSKGYTQAQFAEITGMDRAEISRLCNRQTFTLKKISQIASALGEEDLNKYIKLVKTG